jgi:hypothetical protein
MEKESATSDEYFDSFWEEEVAESSSSSPSSENAVVGNCLSLFDECRVDKKPFEPTEQLFKDVSQVFPRIVLVFFISLIIGFATWPFLNAICKVFMQVRKLTFASFASKVKNVLQKSRKFCQKVQTTKLSEATTIAINYLITILEVSLFLASTGTKGGSVLEPAFKCLSKQIERIKNFCGLKKSVVFCNV